MCHALIVEDNLIISRAIQDRLTSAGFDSFDHAWTEDQAVAAAASRSPSLVVMGDSLEAGTVLNAARRISMQGDVAILMVTADRSRMRKELPDDIAIDGPFPLNEIENVVALARTG